MKAQILLVSLAMLAFQAEAQSDRIIPGLPPDEYVDVTGDGVPDLLVVGETEHVSDPQQPGYLGKYTLGVRTMKGTSVLMWSTPSNQRWYTVEDSTRLDTGLLAGRIHFRQLRWTDANELIEFNLLERPIGPGISKEADGWYGTGEHYESTMVLRNTTGANTGIAAFTFELPYPYGRVVIKTKSALRVPKGFGKEGDPLPPKPAAQDRWDFGHENVEPQVIIPAGLPPDEFVNLNSDEVDDVVITGYEDYTIDQEHSGYYVRGISPLPGTEFLMTVERWGVPGLFRLREGEVLTPERLAAGLRSNLFAWANADTARVFFPVLRHPVSLPDSAPEWMRVDGPFDGALVYRTREYDRPIIGTLSIIAHVPGGEFGVRPETWVEEGQALESR